MVDKNAFTKWLNERFLEWGKSTGKPPKIAAWARVLKVNRDLLNQWLLGNGGSFNR